MMPPMMILVVSSIKFVANIIMQQLHSDLLNGIEGVVVGVLVGGPGAVTAIKTRQTTDSDIETTKE